MSTGRVVECPLCLHDIHVREHSMVYHECTEDYPECDHHDALCLQLEGIPPTNEIVFVQMEGGAVEIVGHCFRTGTLVRGQCTCHQGLMAQMAQINQ